MKKLLRSVATVALATVVSGTLVAGLAGTAHAGTAPPWESTITPTPEVGGLTFYNASGQVITSGSTSSGPVAAFIQGSSTVRAGDTTAVLDAYTPVLGVAAGQWSGEGVSGTTTFPNASAPSSLASSPLPLVTGATTDYSLENYVGDFPNNDTSTTDGYAGLYVLRLYTNASGHTLTTNYDEAVISISGTGTSQTWTLDYSPTSATTTTLAASPASPQPQGTAVGLTATVTPGAPGTVQFENGGSPLGSPVPVSGGTATTNVTGLPVGANSLTAVFTPTSGSAFAGSTSSASTYTITGATSTSTSLSVSPTSPQNFGTSETLTATETPSVAGSVQFLDNGTDLGSAVAVSGGIATDTTSALPIGTDSLTAVFTPTSTAYASSTSAAVSFVVQPLGDPTATALSVNPSSAAAASAVTITADVSDTTTSSPVPAGDGTVQFYDNGTNVSGVVSGSSTAVGSPVALAAGGVAAYDDTAGFGVGAHNLVAVFTPTAGSTAYKPSTSLGVVFTGLPTGTTTSDPQDLNATIPAGGLYISTPYTATNPFNLGTAVLNPGGSEFTASAPFGSATNPGNGVSITDTQAGGGPWTASATVTNFTNSGTGVINGENLAFLNVVPVYISGNALQAGDVTTNNVTSAATTGTPYGTTDTGSDGLKGGPHAFATAASGNGSVYVDGTLSLVAPSSTPAGLYSATLTFTIA